MCSHQNLRRAQTLNNTAVILLFLSKTVVYIEKLKHANFVFLQLIFLFHTSTLSYLNGNKDLIISLMHLPVATSPDRGFSLWRFFGPICSDFRNLFRNSGIASSLCKLSLPSSCSRILTHVEHLFYPEELHTRKLWSFVGSRTWVFSIRSLKIFHCTSRPRLQWNIMQLHFKFQLYYNLPLKNTKFWLELT